MIKENIEVEKRDFPTSEPTWVIAESYNWKWIGFRNCTWQLLAMTRPHDKREKGKTKNGSKNTREKQRPARPRRPAAHTSFRKGKQTQDKKLCGAFLCGPRAAERWLRPEAVRPVRLRVLRWFAALRKGKHRLTDRVLFKKKKKVWGLLIHVFI